MAYGEEMDGDGVSAFRARPAGAAATEQYLPLVRAASRGDSLVAIANAAGQEAEVQMTFVPVGGGAPVARTVPIGPRGALFLDLAGRGRGTVDAPALGRFEGALVLRSSVPLLAMAQETQRDGAGRVRGSGAYNAFGPADLGTEWAVPRAEGEGGARRTGYVVFNPGPGEARLGWRSEPADGGTRAPATADLSVPAGESRWWDPYGAARLAGVGRDRLSADRPVAVVVYDTANRLPAQGGQSWGADDAVYAAVRVAAAGLPSATATSATPTRGTPSPSATPTGEGPTPTRSPTATATDTEPGPSPSASAVVDERRIFMPFAAQGAR
jgi:hypothetical protein